MVSAAANLKAVLSTAGSQFYSGANVELVSANGTLFQRWRIESVGEGYYTITSVATGKVLDVANGGRTPGWHKRVAVHAVRQRRAEMVPEVCGRPVV